MLIQKEIKIEDPSYFENINENALCFDIETTGLNRKYSHISVIGTGRVENGHIIFKQWLLDNPSKEKELLEEFSEYVKNFNAVIQYNGNSFDIPYVRERCSYLSLPDPFKDKKFEDYYVYAKKFKSLLGLDNLKQKSLETLFNINRKDRISGAQCINAYSHYLSFGDETSKNALLLHNEEDVLGLLKINSLTALDEISDSIKIHNAYVPKSSDTSFIIEFVFDRRIPFNIDHRSDTYNIMLKNRRGILHLKGIRCWRKYFFPNPKDYFYIPSEDHAIHKSVGIYVEKDFRAKATRENCYEKKEDIYFYQPCDIISPAMRETYKDKCSWINSKSLLSASDEKLTELVRNYLV